MTEYEDIIHLQRPVSRKHPPMAREHRAAQFAPFAALSGFEDRIRETRKCVEEMVEQENRGEDPEFGG